ncbi:unnamed protein product [Rotaria sp. Silwood2]|nr:unnamed protein product [Rotaria sp. Silwood2]CAF2471574.1 unnamed protein product [Rotaria sp. Silwood2]CAF4312545.1 unnamed protein product [Rotaria sp. Silwood2]
MVYDYRYVVFVHTSAFTYRPDNIMEIRVVATNEEFMPIENDEFLIEVFDNNLKRVGEFPIITIRSGITETFKFPIGVQCNTVTSSFDIKTIFQQFLLHIDKTLRGVIEMHNDYNVLIFGCALLTIGQITEQDMQLVMLISIMIFYHYLIFMLKKAFVMQVYFQAIDLACGQERAIEYVISVFIRDAIYTIRSLHFEAGMKNEFKIIDKRLDCEPTKLKNLIVTVSMPIGNEQEKVQEEKSVETVSLMSTTRRSTGSAKLSTELLSAVKSSVQTYVNTPVASSQISIVGHIDKFYIQLIPLKSAEKFELLPCHIYF